MIISMYNKMCLNFKLNNCLIFGCDINIMFITTFQNNAALIIANKKPILLLKII